MNLQSISNSMRERCFLSIGRVIALLIGLLSAQSSVFAQVDTGSIVGSVKDSSGAIVPGAHIALTNVETGISQSIVSNENGEYAFSPLKIGKYALVAELKGFQRVEHTNITVDVQQRVVVDFLLTPGQMTETVIVTGEPPALQTQDASVGQVISQRTINNLPLNGRNFTFLAQLAAGVTQSQQDSRGLGASGSFATNGMRPAQNNYLLDGIDNNSNLVDFLNGTAFAVHRLMP